jgi:hypothetical protein
LDRRPHRLRDDRRRALKVPTDNELLWREQRLRQEADEVAADLQMPEQLGHIGTPIRTGSVALGLMAWRDLDVTVVCRELDESLVVALSGWFALQPCVRQVTYRDDTGPWNQEPDRYPDGLYLQVRYCRERQKEWNIDIWFLDEPDRQPDLAHLRALPARIDQERRLAILRIKDRWIGNPAYGRSVRSYDIYTAVLDAGVRTAAQFDEWLIDGGVPR